MASEQDNEALVRRAVAAWNENDWEAMELLCVPDVRITAPREWPEAGDTEGWPAVRRQFERLKGAWSEEHIESPTYRSLGGTVLVEGRWVGRAAASGLELDMPQWVLYRIGDERIRWIGFFLNEAEALEAAEAVRDPRGR